MIDKSMFDQKMREFKNLRGIQMTEAVKDSIYERAKNWNPNALDLAIEELIYDQERFTFARLSQIYWKHEHNIREKNWGETKEKEKKVVEDFFTQTSDDGIQCNRQKCKGCNRTEYCKIRAGEWQKGIKWVMSAPKGEGQKRAEELIRIMNDEFMGGL